MNDRLTVLLIDDDASLSDETTGFAHPGVEFLSASSETARQGLPVCTPHVIALCVDGAEGLGLLTAYAGLSGCPPVIALASAGREGMSLEHLLLRAELRGAALALPKPIDAAELALAAAGLASRRLLAEDLSRLVA
jgi:hypothetical protein